MKAYPFIGFLLVLLFTNVITAEIIVPSRRIDWSTAGYGGDIPFYETEIVNVKDYGAKGDGVADDGNAIVAAINAAPTPGVVYFPGGTYKVSSTIVMKAGKVLRGAGAANTVLEFDLGGAEAPSIRIEASQTDQWKLVQSGNTKGSIWLVVADASVFHAGDYVELRQENNADAMYTNPAWNVEWGQNAVGQFFKLISVKGDTLMLDRPLHLNFSWNRPELRKVTPITEVGIEDLHLIRSDNGLDFTIYYAYAANCWIRRIESEYTMRCHVQIDNSLNVEIRDSYFHHAHDYGDGGRAYGIKCEHHTTDCLIENNIFYHLRHAMLMQAGVNGCVYAYNYSMDTYWTSASWDPPDMSIHGHYCFMNLFESNICERLEVADYWGPAGPGNTYFRNRFTGNKPPVSGGGGVFVKDFSHEQNLVGNEVTGGPGASILIDNTVKRTLVHGNNDNGTIAWDPTISDHVLSPSYYLTSKPSFYDTMSWPSLGGDKTLGLGSIPAKVRYESGKYVPLPPVPSVARKVKCAESGRIQLSIAGPMIGYHLPQKAKVDLRLFDVQGREVVRLLSNQMQEAGEHQMRWDGKNLPESVYLARLVVRKGRAQKRFVMMQF